MKITYIDTASVIIDINGFRILTDPVFDNPGKLYHFGHGATSRKTDTPTLTPQEVGDIDLVLLSHHQHQDNLDNKGKSFIKNIKQVISTKAAAREFDNVTGLDNWETIEIKTNKVKGLSVTAVPAQHHPWWLPEFFSGKVIGFIIQNEEQKNGAVYISGDTVYFSGIEKIAKRFRIDTALLHIGAVQFRYLTGWGRYTFDANEAIKTSRLLNPRKIVPIHYRGWTHFKESEETLKKKFQNSGINDRTIWLEKGKETIIE